jgi:hypothetical protein
MIKMRISKLGSIMLRFLVFLLSLIAFAQAAKPMEPLENYNVIMVHGAADSKQGIKDSFVNANVCGAKAYDKYGGVFGAADMTGHYYNNDVNSLPPSRNILIAHSMGGVASREYVQGNFYNGDVDKVITLDSPHEGTGALNMLLSLDNKGWKNTDISDINASKLLSLTIDLILTKMSSDNSSAAAALYGVVSSLGNWGAPESSNLLIELLGYHYAQDEGIIFGMARSTEKSCKSFNHVNHGSDKGELLCYII